MSIRKRKLKDGFTWEFSITISKNPRKQYRKSGFKTKAEAQQAEAEAIKKYKNTIIKFDLENNSFKEVLELYFQHIETTAEYSSGTISNYKGYYKNHLEYFYNFSIKEISPYIVQNWLDINSRIKTPYVINGCRKLCKAAFNYAKKMNLIEINPFENMAKAKEPLILRKRFEIEEIKNILAICKNEFPQFYCLFTLAIFTGMRLGEYSAICIEDIDFKKNQIWITKQYTRRELKDRTKTLQSKRIVDFPPTVGKIIKWHIKKNEIFSGYLFKGKEKDKPISANWVNAEFDKLLIKCGYPKDYMRVHDLRGQFVDILHTLGLPTVYISRQVGHARTSTTNDIYSVIMQEVNTNAKNLVEEKIFCEHFVNI